jgi:hypothetical protein
MKTAALAAFIAATVAAAVATPTRTPSSYTDALYGFSLRPPRFPEAGAGTSATPVFFTAPRADNFSANVNVMVLKQTTTLDTFLALIQKEFDQLALKKNSQTPGKVAGRDTITLDYEGKMQGRELRWLGLIVVDKDRVFQVTCTALKKDFEEHEKEFKACLESFSLTE